MKKRKVWRYSCDYCRKSGCHGGHMRDHECRCFRNPNRHCIVCERQWPVPELAEPMAAMAKITKESEKAMIAAVSEVVESCPACICSAIAQAPLPTLEHQAPGGTDLEGNWQDGISYKYRYRPDWEYKKEREAYRQSEESMRDWL